MFASLALWPIEQVLNRFISNDAHVGKQLCQFAGKAIEVVSESPSLSIVVLLDAQRVRLCAGPAQRLAIKPDARIAGKAVDLLALLTGDPEQRPLANPALQISGETELIQDLFRAMQSLDLQWEDYLAPLLGDTLTEQGSRLQRESSAWLQDSRQRIKRNIEDYLKEEAHSVPHEQSVAAFQDNLDALKLQIDRAAAKAHLLRNRLDALNDQASD